MAPSIGLYYTQTMEKSADLAHDLCQNYLTYEWFEGHFFAENLSTLDMICGKNNWPMNDLKPSSENSLNEDYRKVWQCFLA